MRHKPLSALLPSGLRFLDAPLPAPLSPFLAVRLLNEERDTGLPCSAMCAMGWFRSCLFAGETTPVSAATSKPHSCSLTFWSSLAVSFGLSNMTTFISSSHTLTFPPGPSSQTASTLAVTQTPRGIHSWATLSPKLHTSRLLRTHIRVGRCRQDDRSFSNDIHTKRLSGRTKIVLQRSGMIVCCLVLGFRAVRRIFFPTSNHSRDILRLQASR